MRKFTIAVMAATTFFMLAPAAFSADESNVSTMNETAQTVTSTNADMTAVETAAPEADVIRGTVVSIDKSNNEIVVRDGATQADRRVAVDPNVMASSTLNVGDSVRVDLGGSPKQATSIRVTT